MSHSRALFSNATSLEQVAEHWVRKSAFILNKGVEYRKTQTPDRFIDIDYNALVKDSVPILEKIYSQEGEIPEELMQMFMQAEQENPPGKYGTHNYSLDDFGITKTEIDEKVQLYKQFKTQNPKLNT